MYIKHLFITSPHIYGVDDNVILPREHTQTYECLTFETKYLFYNVGHYGELVC